MGITPPYLYQPASQRESDPCYGFDPKAVTRASYYSVASSTSSPKPRQEGPLIDFNRHPDSYVIVPSSRPADLAPMHPNTKKRITVTRWVLFVLRMLQLLGALGALACVIIIRGVADVQGWILRIPPAFDAAMCAYSLIHLRRPAKERPAASSAGYGGFSIFMDVGLISFYVFIAYFAEANWSMSPGESGRWTSFFHSDAQDAKVLEAAFLIGAVTGGLHLFSIPIDIFLFIVFRKIARFPPDMNPLEDNLTSRVSRTHKYKNSDLSAMSERKSAAFSRSTLNLSSPSRLSTSRDQLIPETNGRPMSFYQSRTNLDSSYSGHTQESARQSRFEYQQAASARASQANLHGYSESRSRSRSRSAHRQSHQRYSTSSQRPSTRGSYVNMDHDPMPTRPLSFVTATENLSRDGTPQSPVADQQKQALLSDNWYVLADDDADLSSPRRTPVPELESDHGSDYHAHEPHAAQLRLASEEYRELLPQPLRMHPPTPPKHADSPLDNTEFYFGDVSKDNNSLSNYSLHLSEDPDVGRALTVPSAVSAKSSFYSQPTPDISRSNTPKGKRYGDLASAQQNIRGAMQEQSVPRGQGRVVSRTGVDIADASVMYLTSDDSRGNRGRNVSGKIAEEGLGGEWAMRKRQVSGYA